MTKKLFITLLVVFCIAIFSTNSAFCKQEIFIEATPRMVIEAVEPDEDEVVEVKLQEEILEQVQEFETLKPMPKSMTTTGAILEATAQNNEINAQNTEKTDVSKNEAAVSEIKTAEIKKEEQKQEIKKEEKPKTVAQATAKPIEKKQAPAPNTKQLIVQTAQKLGVDPFIALSIAKIESNFDVTTKSRQGNIGLYQLTPATAKKLGINPYIVKENIEGGLKYYQMLYKKYGSVDVALAAYNAGPGNVAKYKGVPPFAATKNFIRNIKREAAAFKSDKLIKSYM